MIQEIDFLPQSYHVVRQRRKKRNWRRSIAAVCLLLMGLGTVQQQRTESNLQKKRDQIRAESSRMIAQLGDPVQVQQQIDDLDARAELRVMLMLRPRPTRVLETLTGLLPKHVSLKSLRAAPEMTAQTNASSHPIADTRAGVEQEAHPFEDDLLELEQELTAFRQSVSLRGTAPDDVAVSEYIRRLDDSGLFDDVRLQFTEELEFREHRLRTFEIRLLVRRPRRATDPRPNSASVSATLTNGGQS